LEDLMKRFEALKKEVEDLKQKLGEPPAQEAPPRVEEPPKSSTPSGPESIEKMLMAEVRGIVGEKLIAIGAKTFQMSRLVEGIEPDDAEKLLKVLASADRIRILKSLFLEGKYFSQLQELTGLGPSPLNFHLTQLKEAGLVEQEQLRGRYVSTLKGRETLSLLGYLLGKVSGQES
jgi:DNA-binding transcriptional ArsR family regulator